VLVLHGGASRAGDPMVSPAQLSVLRMVPVARRVARAGRGRLAVLRLLNTWRGWDTTHTPVDDVAWALDELRGRLGGLPTCLVGHSLGGRAALLAGDRDGVRGVVALNPWVYPYDDADLSGRRVLIVHGTEDDSTVPELSYRLAERVKKVNRDVCRFEVHSDGHSLHQHRAEVFALTTDFVLGNLLDRPFARPVVDAMAAPPPLGLRMPLASGFGRSLRP